MSKTSYPKASNGQRFLFPAQLVLALSSFFVCMERIRAAAPIGDKVHRMGRFLIRLSIHPSIHLSICPSVHLEAWLAGPQARLGGPEEGTDGRTDKWKISPFYRTLSPIGAAALHPPCKPRKCHFKVQVKQGKGTSDHLMALGYLLELNLFKILFIRTRLYAQQHCVGGQG